MFSLHGSKVNADAKFREQNAYTNNRIQPFEIKPESNWLEWQLQFPEEVQQSCGTA